MTLDTVVDESRKMADRWQIVRQGLRLGFVAETGSFITMDALSTIFCLLCLVSYLLLSYPGMFLLLIVFLRLCSSHLYSPASSTCCFLLCHLCPLFFRNFLRFYLLSIFLGVLFSWVACLLCYRTRYVSTLFAYLDSLATLVFLCLTMTVSCIALVHINT